MQRKGNDNKDDKLCLILGFLQGATFGHVLSAMVTLMLVLPRGKGTNNGGGDGNCGNHPGLPVLSLRLYLFGGIGCAADALHKIAVVVKSQQCHWQCNNRQRQRQWREDRPEVAALTSPRRAKEMTEEGCGNGRSAWHRCHWCRWRTGQQP